MTPKEKEILFTQVLENHKDQIYRVCWGFSEHNVDVEDLFQEVLLNVWKGIEKFKGKSSLNTWVHKVALNTCLLWKRNKKRRVVLNFTEQAVESPEMATIENKMIHNERIQKLMDAIRSLNKIDRSIALLLLEELSHKEIAEITGTNSNNIGVKIHRIKEKLKNKLQ